MSEIRVNPTRMELKKLKTRLIIARQGHKLLKDKRDELMRQFLKIVQEAKEQRTVLCEQLTDVGHGMAEAAAENEKRILTEALMLPVFAGKLYVGEKNIMGVPVPEFRYASVSRSDGPAYGLAFTSGEMDRAIDAVNNTVPGLIRLAEAEKTLTLLCAEIEQIRRRVNALEYIVIPRYERAIRNISMKLDENERGNQVRLMKVKDMMIAAQMQIRKEE